MRKRPRYNRAVFFNHLFHTERSNFFKSSAIDFLSGRAESRTTFQTLSEFQL